VEASFTEVPNCFHKNAKRFSSIYCGMKSSILKARQQSGLQKVILVRKVAQFDLPRILLNLKDGDDFGQVDEGRKVLKQAFDDDFSSQYFLKDLETIFVEEIGETEYDL
jgi:hypothetical protein